MSPCLSLPVGWEVTEVLLALLGRPGPPALAREDLLRAGELPPQEQVAALERLDLIGPGELRGPPG